MTQVKRPHLVGVDDGPFEKRRSSDTPVVAVVMEGRDLVEGVAIRRFPVDGADATSFLSEWLLGLRFHSGLQGIVLGGITLAGLGIVDITELARRTRLPVLVVNRRDPSSSRLTGAFRAAGLASRIPILAGTPPSFRSTRGIYLACAGMSPERADTLAAASSHKADLPEPLRLAHLIATAIVHGTSRGRV